MRILAGEDRLAAWWETASDEEVGKAADALLAINDDTWRLHYDHYQEVTLEDTWIPILQPGLTLTIRFFYDLDGFQLIHVGRDEL